MPDVVRAMSEAIRLVSAGQHDSLRAHSRIREFYNWTDVTVRTEKVYEFAMAREQQDTWSRIKRCDYCLFCIMLCCLS